MPMNIRDKDKMGFFFLFKKFSINAINMAKDLTHHIGAASHTTSSKNRIEISLASHMKTKQCNVEEEN